jgi:hypothetical protein
MSSPTVPTPGPPPNDKSAGVLASVIGVVGPLLVAIWFYLVLEIL